jgi:hypothetical protein
MKHRSSAPPERGPAPPAGVQGAERRGRVLRLAAVLGLAALTYLPLYGLPLSLVLPFLTFGFRRQLWPGRTTALALICSLLAWLGLWWPAATSILTGWSIAGAQLSTAWLVIPLCGPIGPGTLVLPALAAAAACGLGLVISTLRRQPWVWVLAAWAAPWVHHLVLVTLPQHAFVC